MPPKPRKGKERAPHDKAPTSNKTGTSSKTKASSSKVSSSFATALPTAAAPLAPTETSSPLEPGETRVGFEFEGFLRRKGEISNEEQREILKEYQRTAFYLDFAENYNETTISIWPRAYSEYGAKGVVPLDTSKWCITDESTINPNFTLDLGWSCEIISPILHVDNDGKWMQKIFTMFGIYVPREYDIGGNDTCGTHVHVSKYGGYSFDEIKNIAASVVFFEPAFDALVPSSRLDSNYIKSNWVSPCIDQMMARYPHIKRIRAAARIDQFVRMISPDKYYAFNFRNLLNSAGTIEFRQPPHVYEPSAIVQWIQLAYSFIGAASIFGTANVLEDFPGCCPPCIGVLSEFISRGFTMYLAKYRLVAGEDCLYKGSHLQRWLARENPESFERSRIRGGGDPESYETERIRQLADDEYTQIKTNVEKMKTEKQVGGAVFGNVWAP